MVNGSSPLRLSLTSLFSLTILITSFMAGCSESPTARGDAPALDDGGAPKDGPQEPKNDSDHGDGPHAPDHDQGVDGAAPSRGFTVRGMGGGGGLFVPSISPHDAAFMLVACDMSGVYYSHDAGAHWRLIHYQELTSASHSAPPAYFRDKVFWHTGSKLVISHDKGVTWAPVPATPWGSQKITTLYALSGSPDVLFVGTDAALWRSVDDGATFTSVIGAHPREIVALGDELLTVSGDRTLQRSNDRGKTWSAQTITVGGSASSPVTSLTGGSDGTHTILFITTSKGTFRSKDKGTTWTSVFSSKGQNTVQMAPSQVLVAYAAKVGGTEVWSTRDGGDHWAITFNLSGANKNVDTSWVQSELHWGYYLTDHGFFASRSDPKVALVSTQGELFVTRDGGSTWKQGVNESLGVLAGDPSPRYKSIGLEVTSCWKYLVDPSDPQREYIAYTDIGFARSRDRAATWSYGARGCKWTNTFYDVIFDPKVKGRMIAATSNRHDIPHWTNISPNIPGKKSHRGGICVSNDYGQTWTSASQGLPERPCTSVVLDPTSSSTGRTLYASIFGEGVYKSTDGGKQWFKKSKGLGHVGNMHVYRLRRHPVTGALFALITARRVNSAFGPAGGLWRSDDGAETWKDISTSMSWVWPTTLAIDPSDDKRIFVTAATAPGNPQGGVYRTLDGGVTWKHILKDADVAKSGGSSYDHFMAVTIHPDDSKLIYAGTNQHGLWLSRDGGESWRHWKSFPFKNVQSVSVDPRDTSRLLVTTFGGGAWEGPHLP